MKKLLFCLCCLLSATNIWAYDVQEDGIYYNLDKTNKTAGVTYGTSLSGTYSGDISIPSFIESDGVTYSVNSIVSYAFYECTSLTSISLPNSLTSIGNYSFYNCEGLQSISLPNSLTNIEECAFYQCSGLQSITIPSSVTSIAASAFRNCTGLTSLIVDSGNRTFDSRECCNAIIETVTNTFLIGCKNSIIPNSVEAIGDFAFFNCTDLQTIVIPNSVTSIGSSAFLGCTALTSVKLSKGITNIGYRLFQNCSSLTTIDIPDNVTSIGERAFESCSALQTVNMSKNLESVGSCAFYGCSKLSGVSLPNTVDTIGQYAFSGCTELKSFAIPTSLRSLSYYTFNNCSGLTSILIPAGVTSIQRSAFLNCSSLASISIDSNNKIYDSRDNCNAIIETATNTLIFGISTTVIPKTVTAIGEESFCYCTGLTSITIPNSVTIIGRSAFYGCTALTSVTIPESVTEIGSQTFDNTPWWTSYTASSSHQYGNIYYINNVAYKAINTSITSCSFKANTVSISADAFYACAGLTSVSVPNSVISIGERAFCNTSLNSVSLGSSLQKIDESAFELIDELTSITIPNSVTYIGRWAFSSTGLTSISLSSSITSISDYAFHSCTKLTSVQLSGSVKTIGASAFSGCSSLTTITIPASVESIGRDAFSGTKLTSVQIPGSVKTIGQSAFSGCSSLTSVTIPASVESIGRAAFTGCKNLKTITVDSNNKYYDNREGCVGIIETSSNTLIFGNDYTVIPKGVTSIGNRAMCGNMTSLVIPSSITTIEDMAFYSCSSLTSITLPRSVKKVGWCVFYYNYMSRYFGEPQKLEVHCNNTIPPVCNDTITTFGSGANYGNTWTLFVPYGTKDAYSQAKGWRYFNSIVEEYVPEPDYYTLLDTQTSYENADNKTSYTEIDYVRTFNDTDWQTLYVPFALSYDEWSNDFEVARLNDVHQYDDNKDGTVDRVELEAFLVTEGSLEPNTPYLIKANTLGEKTLSAASDPTLYKTEVNSFDCSSLNARFIFTGNYSTIAGTTAKANRYYTLKDNRLSSGNNGDLTPFRWYLTIDGRVSAKVNPEAVNVKIGTGFSDATAIKRVYGTASSINGTPAVSCYYSLDGVKLNTPQKGINIVKYSDGSTRRLIIK